MQNHLTDLDELLENVRNSRSQDYISESIRCYRSGAYRSAIITTWVAVCIDIIDKIRELSSEGDGNAKKLDDKLNKLGHDDKKGIQEYENSLLESAENNLNIISNHEARLLQRIKDDRNFCAHPDFQIDGQNESITPEGARAHIVNACNALLLHTPIRGKVLIEKIQNIVAGDSFSPDNETAYIMLESEYYLGRAQDSVFRSLTIIFLHQIFHENDWIPEQKADRIFAALHAISRIKPNVYTKTLKEKLDPMLSDILEKNLKRIFLLPHLWSYIKKPNKERITQLLSTFSYEDIIKYRLHRFTEEIPAINKALVKKIETLETDDKLNILSSYPMKEFKKLMIEIFINSNSPDETYKNAGRYLLPHAQYFDADDLKKILNGSLQNATNQIIPSISIESTLIDLFNGTQQNIHEYKAIWSKFWMVLNPYYKNKFITLSGLLTEDNVISVAPPMPTPPAPTAVAPIPPVAPDDNT